MLTAFAARISKKSREKRARLLHEKIHIEPYWRILDLGGGNGDHAATVFPGHRKIVVFDYQADKLAEAEYKHGFTTVISSGDPTLPFETNYFDLVFCSSVIEHVTGDKLTVTTEKNTKNFTLKAKKNQIILANEIRRVGKRYFVQTPNKMFIVETHSWLPLPFAYLPRGIQLKILLITNKIIPKKTAPDWNLLRPEDMKELFPDATIILERYFWWPKSIIAIRADCI